MRRSGFGDWGRGELPPSHADVVASKQTAGDVGPPLREENTFYLLKKTLLVAFEVPALAH